MGTILNLASKISKKIIKYDNLVSENKSLNKRIELLENEKSFGWPNGHFYSPVHSLDALKDFDEVVKRSREKFTESIPGFSEKRMIEEFNRLKNFFSEFDYPQTEEPQYRFYSKNSSISIMDALILFSMMKLLKPKRIIEIGSGFTSALMMDVDERDFNNKIQLTFVEPFPEVLKKRMKKGDDKKYKIISNGVQSVPLNIFEKLEKNDILFIDSTHVSKFNSDVNYELFDILPVLKPGVIIHFHDILDGFEYPLYWLNQGWAWNEAYLLRAYLIGNKDYDVLLMTNYLSNRFPKLLEESYPKEDVKNGGDLWIRKK